MRVNDFEDDNVFFVTNFYKYGFTLHISVNQPITLKKLSADLDFKFSNNDKFFVNGFQS